MQASRIAPRAARAVRVNAPAFKRNARFATNDASSATPSSPQASGALYGGLVGGFAAVLVGYGFYHFSGARGAVVTASQAKSYYDGAIDKIKVNFKEQTPDTNEALETLRSTANKYASFVPGGKGYVDAVFKDIDVVRKKHGSEVDEIVSEAYGQLRDASKKGMNIEALYEAWDILMKQTQKLAGLAGDAGEDILNNHPQLKNQLGGSLDQLKQYGDQFGPEAKKQVQDTFNEISGILKQGFQWDTVSRVRSLVQNKAQELQKLQNQAFDKGWEQVQPMLEKNPKVKEFVDQNMDTLKQGNVVEVLNKVRSAVSSGDVGDLEQYVKQAGDKAKTYAPDGLSSWLEMIPNGSKIIPQLQKLQQVATQQGEEAKELAKDTMQEIADVLEKRGQKLDKLWQEGKKNAKDQ